jgi:hypothetical protein
VASVTGRDVREVEKLSVQQLAFCCGVPPEPLRDCQSGWSLEDALKELLKCAPLLLDRCLPYKPDYTYDRTAAGLCSADRLCQNTSRLASNGTFGYKAWNSVWTVQARGGGREWAGRGGWRARRQWL